MWVAYELQVPLDQLAGLPQPGHQDDVFGAGPAVALVVGAVHQFFQLDAGADVQRADALGSVELVAGHGEKIDAEVVRLHRDLADGLGAVAMHQHAVAVGDAGDLRDGLDCADLVVGVHDGDEDGLGGDGLLNLLRVDHAMFVDGEVGGADAVRLQVAAHLGHGRMFDRRGDDVVATVTVGFRNSLDGVVVGLGAAAGEDEIVFRATEHTGNLLAGAVDSLTSGETEGVAAGGVAEEPVHVGQHGLGDGGVDGSGGVVVQVDAVHIRLRGDGIARQIVAHYRPR